ncbi:hypothetical protein ACFL59_16045 [Planctomycetota bacterium]
MKAKAPAHLYLSIGFFAGAVFVSCSGGGGTSVPATLAAAIGNAIDVVFDNGTTGLAATNVQDALDETNAKLATHTHTGSAPPAQGTAAATVAVESALESLGAQVNKLRTRQQSAFRSFGEGVFTQLVVVPTQGFTDIRPPAGEVWAIETIVGASLSVRLTNGSTDLPFTGVGAEGLIGMNLLTGHSVYVRLRNTGSKSVSAFVAARRLPVDSVGVFSLAVPQGRSIEVRPPEGETWLIGTIMAENPTSNTPVLTDGTHAAAITPSINGFGQEGIRLLPLDHGHWLKYVNHQETAHFFVAMGVKLP